MHSREWVAPRGRARPVSAIETDLPPIAWTSATSPRRRASPRRHVSGDDDRKKYILEATGSGVAHLRLRRRRPDGRLPAPAATTLDRRRRRRTAPRVTSIATSAACASRTSPSPAGLRQSGWAQGVCVGDYDNDGAPRPVRHLLRPERALPQPGRRHVRGRDRAPAGLAGRDALGHRLLVRRLRPRRPARPRRHRATSSSIAPRSPSRAASGYCLWKGIPVMCGPRGLPFARNRLFRNDGQRPLRRRLRGERHRQARAAATASPSSPPTSTTTAIPTSTSPATRRRACCTTNQRDGTFEEIGLLAGVALNEDGQEQGGMGVAVADYDEDGHFDIVKTNFSDDVPNVYHNNGDGTFEDRVFQSGPRRLHGVRRLGRPPRGRRPRRPPRPADGQRPRLSRRPTQLAGVQYRQPRLLYWNVGGGRFKDISGRGGPGISRGLVVARVRGRRPRQRRLARGRREQHGRAAQPAEELRRAQELAARACGGHAGEPRRDRRAGARVRRRPPALRRGPGRLELTSRRTTRACTSAWATTPRYERIEVQWPAGEAERYPGGPANRIVVVTQGAGVRVDGPSGGATGARERRAHPAG